jgi:microcystin-dependent protein
MPRNSSGVYVQPASDVNPPIAGTVIDQIGFAGAITDIATELTNSLDRLGRAPMQAILQMGAFRIANVGAPVASTDVARLVDIGGALPSGAIMDFAMTTAPTGWLICDGSTFSRTGVTLALFTAIGTTWGIGDGSTTANLPDFRGTVRRTWDNGKGLDPSRVFASYQADMLASHNHTQNAHNHGITDPGHQHTVGVSGNITVPTASPTVTVPLSGGGLTGANVTSITINNSTATNNATGAAETAPKNYAVLTCIRI